MTLRVGLTHPALTKLTFMDYLLTMLRILLRRKLGYDNDGGIGVVEKMQISRHLLLEEVPFGLMVT